MKQGFCFSAIMMIISIHMAAAQKPVHTNASHQKHGIANFTYSYGAIIRGDPAQRKLALVFTGDAFADGGAAITHALQQAHVKASFFLTGRFYKNPSFRTIIQRLKEDGHYLGPHSNEHLLYCDWSKRDSLLVTKDEFTNDLLRNYAAAQPYGIRQRDAPFFLPPYEWYNDSIVVWTKALQLQLINYTPGTLSHADYTTPDAANYRSTDTIWQSIRQYESHHPGGLNGFILLMHIGTDAKRTDKLYMRLPQLIQWLQQQHYQLVRIDELLKQR